MDIGADNVHTATTRHRQQTRDSNGLKLEQRPSFSRTLYQDWKLPTWNEKMKTHNRGAKLLTALPRMSERKAVVEPWLLKRLLDASADQTNHKQLFIKSIRWLLRGSRRSASEAQASLQTVICLFYPPRWCIDQAAKRMERSKRLYNCDDAPLYCIYSTINLFLTSRTANDYTLL